MKKYNYHKIRNEVRKIVKKACYARDNKFKSSVWQYHILPVVEHSLILGRKFKADLEILELSALLHDYASLTDFKLYKHHHLHGACLADKILSKLGYPKDKIKHIKECIVSHRGSVRISKKSIEAKILASADAMAHISELADMFYLTFGVHKYKTREGAKWLGNKLQRSWRKIMPEGKRMIKEDYQVAMRVIKKAGK